MTDTAKLTRLNKAIADSGYCARRKADELISTCQVKVNGKTVMELGTKVNLETDIITIQGKPLPKVERYYLLMHKPVGVVTSRKGGKSQTTIYDLIPEQYQSVDPAGRLDQDSSGALILSNDGDFIFQITHPRFHVPKRYAVTLHKTLQPADQQALQRGIILMPENKLAKMASIQPDPRNPKRYKVELITGLNRQIRRSVEALGYRVEDLHRLSFGPATLRNLEIGGIRPLTASELKQLKTPITPTTKAKSTGGAPTKTTAAPRPGKKSADQKPRSARKTGPSSKPRS